MILAIKMCIHAKLICFYIELIIYIKMDLALYNLTRSFIICHEIQQTKPKQMEEDNLLMLDLRFRFAYSQLCTYWIVLYLLTRDLISIIF